jgi:hypothetical protein
MKKEMKGGYESIRGERKAAKGVKWKYYYFIST